MFCPESTPLPVQEPPDGPELWRSIAVRAGAERAAQDAVRAEAEVKLARGRGQLEIADRHENLGRSARALEAAYREHEAAFADTMGTRSEWERATEHQRRTAVAADSEYRRRHPEEKLPPLRSAEPAKPAQEERRALIPNGGADYLTPRWVADLAAGNREARERLDELKNVRVPGEDHEWEDEGQRGRGNWYGSVRRSCSRPGRR